MNVLILGGTRFVGRSLVQACLTLGHQVTLFNRGLTNPGLFPDVETIIGDRFQAAAFTALTGRSFDAVIDVAAYTPQAVRIAVEALAARTDRWVFISTRSVYADQQSPQDETGTVLQLDPHRPAEENSYGARKAAGEQIVVDAFGDHALIPRPGMIVGPHDGKDRFTYWPRRMARGGTVVAPGAPGDIVQFIDVRDLATWTVTALAAGLGGIYNITGPAVAFEDFLAACPTTTNPVTGTIWVSGPQLLAAGVSPEAAPAMWITAPPAGEISVAKARAAGLRPRPIASTLSDILDWDTSRGGLPAEQARFAAEQEELLLLVSAAPA